MQNLPFYTTQALDVLSNNMCKYGFLFALAYLPIGLSLETQQALFISNLVATVYIVPFFIISYWAGNLSDQSDKVLFLQRLKLLDIAIVTAICISLYQQEAFWVLTLIGLLGVKAAAFTPVKYGYLREIVDGPALISANGIIQATSLVGIIFAFMSAGLVLTLLESEGQFGLLLVALALLGYLTSLSIRKVDTKNGENKTRHGFSLAMVWQTLREEKILRFYLVAIGWFWMLGTSFMTQFINFIKLELQGSPTLATIALSVFVVGMTLGTLLSRRFHNLPKLTYFVSGCGLSAMCFAITKLSGLERTGHELGTYTLQAPQGGTVYMLLGTIFMIGFCATAFVVPIYARIQLAAPKHLSSTMIGISSITNACFVVASSGFAYWLLSHKQVGLVSYFEWLSALNLGFILLSLCYLLKANSKPIN